MKTKRRVVKQHFAAPRTGGRYRTAVVQRAERLAICRVQHAYRAREVIGDVQLPVIGGQGQAAWTIATRRHSPYRTRDVKCRQVVFEFRHGRGVALDAQPYVVPAGIPHGSHLLGDLACQNRVNLANVDQ